MLWRKPQRTGTNQAPIVALGRQLKRWRRANRRMGWGIPSSAFLRLPPPPVLTPADRAAGFAGVILSYGFDSGYGPSADAVLSGKRAWDYVSKWNEHHRLWAWSSLVGIVAVDLYIRLVANDVITDPNTWKHF